MNLTALPNNLNNSSVDLAIDIEKKDTTNLIAYAVVLDDCKHEIEVLSGIIKTIILDYLSNRSKTIDKFMLRKIKNFYKNAYV